MTKAEADGTYTIEQNGETLHFFIAKGDEIPEGATYQEGEAAPEQKDAGKAPENKAR